MFAKHAAAHKNLNEQFNQRKIQKTYMAVTHGVIERAIHRIDTPIRQFGSGRMGIDLKQGKPCITEFSVTQRFEAYTLVKIHPLTGRRHQIRVHFYSIGHPLVGDSRYGEKINPISISPFTAARASTYLPAALRGRNDVYISFTPVLQAGDGDHGSIRNFRKKTEFFEKARFLY